MLQLRLRKNLHRTLKAGHPWVYRDALEPHSAEPGSTVEIVGGGGEPIGRGLAEEGAIGARLFTTREEAVDSALFTRRFLAAYALREELIPADTSAFRTCHGEGDRMPGVVVDEYGATEGSYAVMRLDGTAAPAIESALVAALVPLLKRRGVRGLLVRIGRRGHETRLVWGEGPANRVSVKERGMTLIADLWHGQKTGLFLDHRESRSLVRSLAQGRRVLNLYAYTGGFSVAAGLGGAAFTTTVDVAPAAIDIAHETWGANDLPHRQHQAITSDVFEFLESEDRKFDLIISDPPSFAPNEKSVDNALATYARLHAACLRRLLPGGLFVAASCSTHVRGPAFDETVSLGARQAGRILQVIHRGSAPMDHPRLLAFPEGDYLDVVVGRSLG